jgi:hypothetical protein
MRHTRVRQPLNQHSEPCAVHPIAQVELGRLGQGAAGAAEEPAAPLLAQQKRVQGLCLAVEALDPAQLGQQRDSSPIPEEVVRAGMFGLDMVQVLADPETGTRVTIRPENAWGVGIRLQAGEKEDGTTKRWRRLSVRDEIGRHQRATGKHRRSQRKDCRAPGRHQHGDTKPCDHGQQEPDRAGQDGEAQHQRPVGQVRCRGAQQQTRPGRALRRAAAPSARPGGAEGAPSDRRNIRHDEGGLPGQVAGHQNRAEAAQQQDAPLAGPIRCLEREQPHGGIGRQRRLGDGRQP